MQGFTVTQLARGASLFEKGQTAVAMYFVVTGTVDIVSDNNSLSMTTGAIVGAAEFLNGWQYEYSAHCTTDVGVLALDEKNIVAIFRKQPQIGYVILKRLAAEVPIENRLEKVIPKNAARTNAQTSRQQGIGQLRELLPKGHPSVDITSPDMDENYLYYKEVECPICETKFQGANVRESRLMTKEILPDFRVIYRDFEPLWYYVWVCPHCLYAYPYKQFLSVKKKKAETIRKVQLQSPLQESFEFGKRRSLNDVFLAYFLTLRTYEQIDAVPQQFGNLWLRLIWLYEDVGSEDLSEWATKKALEYFKEANMSTWRSEAGDQKLYIIMAELSQRLGLAEDAIKYLREAVNIRQGNERYRRQASDRIQDLRRGD